MTSPILFAGGEDFNFIPLNAGIATAITFASWGIDTTAGRFRSGYARYAMTFQTGGQSLQTAAFLRNINAFSSSNFWTSGRVMGIAPGGVASSSGNVLMRWVDSLGNTKLQIKSNGNMPGGVILLQTVNNAGTATTVATSSGSPGFLTANPGTADKLDVYINYAVSGTFTVYSNGAQVVTYSGDLTTNGTSSLAYCDWGWIAWDTGNFGNDRPTTSWSECIIATRDTRNFSVVTQAPTANGNAHAWTAGTAANAAQNSMITAQASPQYSDTPNQIQQYQVTPAIPTGNFSVISVVQTAQATVGTSGPTKFDFMVRTSSTDYTSSPDTAPGTGWATFTYAWDTNPNTSAPWLTSDLAASSTSFNMGLKSIT